MEKMMTDMKALQTYDENSSIYSDFSLASLQTDVGNTVLILSSDPKMLKEHTLRNRSEIFRVCLWYQKWQSCKISWS